MAQRTRRAGSRQIIIPGTLPGIITPTPATQAVTPTQPAFPIIATEVFWELNPELHVFLENKPPQYFPSYYGYGSYGHYGAPPGSHKKGAVLGCAPRRLCIPRPCAPV